MSYVLGIDIGSSSIKIAAMDEETNIAFIFNENYSFKYSENKRVIVDLNEVWEKVQKLLGKAFAKADSNHKKISGISLSTFCNSTVVMDVDGNPLYPGIVYLDYRSKKQTDKIKQVIGENDLYKITKNRIEPGMFSVTTLLWIKENEAHIYSSIYKWGNISTFIYYKLTGKFVMDWTQASFSGIFNIHSYEWSRDFCLDLGVPTSVLPELKEPGTQIGVTDVMNRYIIKNIPVITGGADTASAALAVGVKDNEVFESVGTSNVLTVSTNNTTNLDNRFLNRCHVIKDKWLSHGAMSTPGASIQWFYENFLKNDINIESTDVLESLPLKSKVGANGVFFLPYMQGERSPIWDPNARGLYIGLNLNTNKADLLRAIYEGTAFGLKQIYEIIEDRYQISRTAIQSIGGGAHNRTWAKIKSDILNKTIQTLEVKEASVYGTCLIAGSFLNFFPPLTEIPCFLDNKVVFETLPNRVNQKEYSKLYKTHLQLYPSLKEHFLKMNN